MEIGNNNGQEQEEFIDHTSLLVRETSSLPGPGFIRESNNFMNLIESPADNVTSASATETNANDFAVTLPSDLQYHSIFQFAHKQTEFNGTAEPSARTPAPALTMESSIRNNDNAFDHKTPTDFMTINGDFQRSTATTTHTVTTEQPNFPPLSLLTEPNMTLDDSDVMNEDLYVHLSSCARKVLPHKKRISRKLKVPSTCDDTEIVRLDHEVKVPPVEQLAVNTMHFNCEICGHSASSQIEFFSHLKQHYEPTTSDTILAAMKTTLEELEPEKDCPEMCRVSEKNDEANQVSQVFNDVHLNFDNFHHAAVRDVMNSNPDDDMKILTSNGIEKCINYVVSQTEPAPLRDIAADEVEFSDTEDMLEGIRSVVVSIEDTCDDMDLMSSNGIRTSWFANDNFSGVAFKSKPFGDLSFGGSLSEVTVANEADVDELPALVKQSAADPNEVIPFPNIKEDLELNCVNETIHSDDTVPRPMTDDEHDESSCNNDIYPKTENAANDEAAEEEEYDDSHEIERVAAGDEKKGSKKQFICTKCDRAFNSSNALKYHHRTHTGLRPHQCDVCGKSFFAQGALKSHLRTHTGAKPFECEHCHRKFRQWGDLKYHTISIHTEEKSHQCEFCGKAFSRKYSLVLHRRIHTSERNYECEYCSKTFRASTYLQNHRKIHTGEKPYECDVCTKRFRVSGDLRRHLRTHQRKPTKRERKTTEVIIGL